MKVISFNINGLRARLHQLQAVIDKHQPDVIGLQEIKVHDEAFPLDDVQKMGYHVYFHGQKAHYGVAMLCKKEPKSVLKGFAKDAQQETQLCMTALKQGLAPVRQKIGNLNSLKCNGQKVTDFVKRYQNAAI